VSDVSPLRSALARVCARADLTTDETAGAVELMMRGEATAAEVAGFLAALRTKGETVDELVGAARAMRAHVARVASSRPSPIDTCGTGGDGGITFSISTAAALVAAGAGAAVAKHGNRAASGRFGGADVLEALGVAIDLPAADVGRCLDEVGMAFLFAPRLHPAMRHVAPIRRELGVRTIFNLLGPLTNPAGVKRQVIGVPSREALDLVAGAVARLGCEHVLVVHSRDGLDEISLSAPTDAIEVRAEDRQERVLDAGTFGLPAAPLAALAARDRDDAARIVREVLDDRPSPAADVVLANAAAALYVAGLAPDLADGVRRARAAVTDGAARRVLEGLVAFTRRASEHEAGASDARARV
jgi:anthranilate phosphoribosyltransferase